MINLVFLINAVTTSINETITVSSGEHRKKIQRFVMNPLQRAHLARIIRVLEDPEATVEIFRDNPRESVRCYAALGRGEYWEFAEVKASGRIYPSTHILTPRDNR